MNALNRGLQLGVVLLALAGTAASCRPDREAGGGEHFQCGFADPAVTTQMGICYVVAEHYVAKQAWPLTRADLSEQIGGIIETEKSLNPEEVAEWSHFLEQFTVLSLKQSGDNLLLRYRFKVDGKTVAETVTFRPGTTADEIMETVTN